MIVICASCIFLIRFRFNRTLGFKILFDLNFYIILMLIITHVSSSVPTFLSECIENNFELISILLTFRDCFLISKQKTPAGRRGGLDLTIMY